MISCRCKCVVGREVISTNSVEVVGVTSVNDELLVLLRRDDNQVAVCSISNDYKLRHHHLPGLESRYLSDMTTCVHSKCLYISDPINNCIHRFVLSSGSIFSAIIRCITFRHTSKWSVPGAPCGLSVTPNCNLLVNCHSPTSKLVELSADSGQCVREITLQSGIKYLWHAVQLTTGQFVVCHGLGENDLHRVCLVDAEGKVTRSYGGQPGSAVGQLNRPWHMAVDEDSQFVFVADSFNNRVMLLSPTLEFVRDFSEGLVQPHRLYFNHTTRRLYVGQWMIGDVAVIQL